ncbi:MAG: MBOAT family protein [Bacteroidia bacterium]|nr:MBOAT family protein [Bacteroidia bacterium]
MAKKIGATDNQKRKKLLLFLSIASNFGLLFYFKYLSFFADSLNVLWIPLFDSKISLTNEILPIGLSFHTFQSVSYVIDVYKKKLKPETHLGIYSTYVLFFPQMVAGPIERFSTLGNELKKNTVFTFDLIKKAAPLILIGLFYKMVIADNCGEYVNSTYASVQEKNNFNVLIAVFLFCIQIYCDFFGYSLIAQGSAKLFGIKLIDNFSFPFFSENLVVFWKKWHISLTSWFRDYVYIPLGGSRVSVFKHLLNIVIVFTLSGLWHGAGFNLIIWGFVHSVFYLFAIYILKKMPVKLPKIVTYIFTFILVAFIFVFFRNGDLSESILIFKNIFPKEKSITFEPVSLFLVLNIVILFFIEYRVRAYLNYQTFLLNNNFYKNLILYSYLLFAILTFSGIDNLPFIYFQF